MKSGSPGIKIVIISYKDTIVKWFQLCVVMLCNLSLYANQELFFDAVKLLHCTLQDNHHIMQASELLFEKGISLEAISYELYHQSDDQDELILLETGLLPYSSVQPHQFVMNVEREIACKLKKHFFDAVEKNRLHDEVVDPILKHVIQYKNGYLHDQIQQWVQEHRYADGSTLLHEVINFSGSRILIQFLLEMGIDIDIQDNKGNTALHYVVKNFDLNMIHTLIQAGSKLNLYNKKWQTPFFIAAEHCTYRDRNRPMMKLLLDAGADINCKGEFSPLVPLWTPLMYACHESVIRQVQFLLDHGADVHARNSSGETALHIATEHYGNLLIVKILVDAGADVNAKNNKNQLPDFWAQDFKMKNYLKQIRDKKAQTESSDMSLCHTYISSVFIV